MIYEYSPEVIFSVVLFATAILGSGLVFLVHCLFRRKKKNNTNGVAATAYLDSPLHASVIAAHISLERGIKAISEVSRFVREGRLADYAEHLFLNTIVFEQEGLSVSLMSKSTQISIGIVYAPGRKRFAQRVASILASGSDTKIAVRCRDSLPENSILNTTWARGNLSGIG